MSRFEEKVFTDKLSALRYCRENSGQFFEATVPSYGLRDAALFVCNTISDCETAGNVEKYGSRADAIAFHAPHIMSRCRLEIEKDNTLYVVAVSLHRAQVALVAYLMGVTRWTKKLQDEHYIEALEFEAAKNGA